MLYFIFKVFFFFLFSFLGNINLLLLYCLHTRGTCALKTDSLPDIYCFFFFLFYDDTINSEL